MITAERAPIIVAGYLTVDASSRDDYLRSCKEVIEAARDTDGCIDFAIGADLVNSTRINV